MNIEPKVYTREQLTKHWPYKCSKCGHQGIDDHEGGGAIADTGDYSDCYCPKCWNNIMDDDAEEGIDYIISDVPSIKTTN